MLRGDCNPVLRLSSTFSGTATFASFPQHPTRRTNGTVKVSADNGATWRDHARLSGLGATFGYSCITSMQADDVIGVLWETNMTGCKGESCRTVFSVVPK